VSNGVPGIEDDLPPRPRAVAAPGARPAIDADPLPDALTEIARIVSATLELKEVFAQVAGVAARVMPFETMGVCRLESQDRMRLYAIAGYDKEEDHSSVARLEDFSPGMHPRAGKIQCIDDAKRALDPRFALDREILESGSRALLGAPLMGGARLQRHGLDA
jgi:hypothetical protein